MHLVLLLIVFFLSASALLELRGVKIPLPVKDAPPMQVVRNDIFKLDINEHGGIIYNKNIYDLQAIKSELSENFRQNSNLIVYIRINPNAPSNNIPAVISTVQQVGINRFTISMEN